MVCYQRHERIVGVTMNKIPMLEKFAAQSLVEHEGELIFSKEKFAELIVKECVQTLIDNSPALYTNESAEEDWDKGYDRAMEDSVQLIRKHFGVEE